MKPANQDTKHNDQPIDDMLYEQYNDWKRWSGFFEYTPLDNDRFSQDFAGLKLERANLFEIGFGQGALLAWAKDNGAEISGCELTKASLDAAEKAGVVLHPSNFDEVGAEKCLDENSLDIVVAFDVFEHLEIQSLRSKLIAISKALKPGGFLVMRYPNGQSPFGLIGQHGDLTHKIALSAGKIEQLAMGTQLETIRYQSATFASHPKFLYRMVSAMRRIVRKIVINVIQFSIATDVPMEPVMVQIMRKKNH